MCGYSYSISDPVERRKTDNSRDKGNNPSNKLKQGIPGVIPLGQSK